MTRKEAIQTEAMLDRLTDLLVKHSPHKIEIHGLTVAADYSLIAREDAESLRRISMTLHRWHELECGTDGGCIERGRMARHSNRRAPRQPDGTRWPQEFESNENGAPYWADHNGERTRYHKIPDREAGALKRLAVIMSRYPSLTSYVQGDPRGCALYILRPGDILEGSVPNACYSRGLAVHQ